MRTFILFFIFFFANIVLIAQIQYNQRYIENVFEEIVVENDIVYGNAPALQFPYLNENLTSPQDLLMDIYQPVDDELHKRPAVVCAHSGAFISGTRKAEDMVAFCDSLAHRGYITVSIDYRLGMNVLNEASSIRGVYRGIQDGRAAIRFLKEFSEDYNIDTNNIYFIGSSAGAFIGIHNLYMDTEAERPLETYTSPDLGCLDCAGNDYQHSGKANGLSALWGALEDTSFIIQSDDDPVYFAHGTGDGTVMFGYGSAFGNPAFPATYGSELIADRLENLGKKPNTYFVNGADHEFYGTDNGDWPSSPNAYWDTVFYDNVDFFYSIHKPLAGFSVQGYGDFEFIDESQGGNFWYWDFGDGTYSTEQNPVHEYENYSYYTVTQFVRNELMSWDTTTRLVSFWLDIEKIMNISIEIYPNPTNDYIIINCIDILEKVSINDFHGKKIYYKESIKEKTIIDVSAWDAGIYIFRCNCEGNIFCRKIIVI